MNPPLRVQPEPARLKRRCGSLPVARIQRTRTIRTIACALLFGALAAVLPASHAADEVRIGQTLRDMTLQGLNGPSRKLSQYRGRALIINVWASWCGPCIEETASLERLVWQEGLGPFTVIGISTDDYADRAQAFLKRSNATISHFIDRDLQMEHMLGASKIPLTVLVDPQGRVLDKIYGARRWDAPESLRLIARAFAPSKAAPAR